MSVISRAFRADELRTIAFQFESDESKFLWDALRLADFPILIPHRPGQRAAPRSKNRVGNRPRPNRYFAPVAITMRSKGASRSGVRLTSLP